MLTKLYITLGMVALIGAALWRYDHVVTVSENRRIAMESALAAVKVLQESIAEEERRRKAADDRLNDHLTRLQVAENETKRLRDCIDDGTCGLRIKTVTTRVSETQGESSTGLVQTADTELAPESRRAYFTLRQDIDKVETLLKSCITELESRTMCY